MKNRDYLFIKRQEGKICNNRYTNNILSKTHRLYNN